MAGKVALLLWGWLVLQVPVRALLEGDTVTLRCRDWNNTSVTSVSFYREEKQLQVLGGGTELSLSPLQLNHSGSYHCRGRVDSKLSAGWKESEPVTVTVSVHVPVANATISPGPLAHQVRAGDPVTLRCSVQVGSAPVTFTWLRHGRQLARGPLLELGHVHEGHSGTYQCVATNQLGQDGHRQFRALSPELVLTVTPRGHWDTVAVNIGRTLLFLLLLLAVIGGCHWWHRPPARKPRNRAPPEEGEVLDPHVVGTERAGGPPRGSRGPAPPRDPRVTNTELPGPHEGQQDPSATYESVM